MSLQWWPSKGHFTPLTESYQWDNPHIFSFEMPMFWFNYWVQLPDNFKWLPRTDSAMWGVMLDGWLVGDDVRAMLNDKKALRRWMPSGQIGFSANIHWFPNKPNQGHQEGWTLVSSKGNWRVTPQKISDETIFIFPLSISEQSLLKHVELPWFFCAGQIASVSAPSHLCDHATEK